MITYRNNAERYLRNEARCASNSSFDKSRVELSKEDTCSIALHDTVNRLLEHLNGLGLLHFLDEREFDFFSGFVLARDNCTCYDTALSFDSEAMVDEEEEGISKPSFW